MSSHRPVARLVLTFALALAVGCSDSDDDSSSAGLQDETARKVVETYARLMFANYSDIESLILDLQDAVVTFIADPTEANLDAVRDAWVTARPYYQESEIGRFYDGPIDDADGPEGAINAWPLDESYIDYVAGDADSGIINDPTVAIDEATLRGANEAGGEKNISIGWHAVEFLLWGQDTDPDGPGDRPATDYVAGGGGTADNQDRRAQYLVLVVDLLLEDIRSVIAEWEPGEDNYRGELESLPVDEAIARIMTGVGSLAFGELRGERLITPYTVKDQEEEHSCFSDLTHLDHLHDVYGVRNVWLGEYNSSDGSHDVSGTGLRDAALEVSEDLANAIDDDIAGAVDALGSDDLIPFDQAILGVDTDPGRETLQQAIDELADFNDDFSELATLLEVDIVTSLQN